MEYLNYKIILRSVLIFCNYNYREGLGKEKKGRSNILSMSIDGKSRKLQICIVKKLLNILHE